MDAIAGELEAAGILTVTTEADGTVIYALTPEGKAIGRQLAMTQGEEARLAMLNELLDASSDT
jgi:DNA-binding PadR family transcriptional regulator